MKLGRIIDGKVEYGKILYLPSLPSASSMLVNTDITNFLRYTYVEGYTSNSWGTKMSTAKIDENSIVLHQEGEKIRVTTYRDTYTNANYNAIIELHYLKNT